MGPTWHSQETRACGRQGTCPTTHTQNPAMGGEARSRTGRTTAEHEGRGTSAPPPPSSLAKQQTHEGRRAGPAHRRVRRAPHHRPWPKAAQAQRAAGAATVRAHAIKPQQRRSSSATAASSHSSPPAIMEAKVGRSGKAISKYTAVAGTRCSLSGRDGQSAMFAADGTHSAHT